MSNRKIISDNYMEDKSDRTSLVKDRILPNISSKITGDAMGLGGAVIGAGLGLAGKKAMGGLRRKIVRQGTASQIGKMFGVNSAKLYESGVDVNRLKAPMKVMFSPEYRKARQLIAAGTGAAYLAPKAKRTGEVLSNTSALKSQYRKQFGVEPSESEMFEAAKLNPNKRVDRSLSKMFYTPNSMTKSTFRNIRQMNRMPNALDSREQIMNSDNMVPVYGAGFATPYANNYSALNNYNMPQYQGIRKHSAEDSIYMDKIASYKHVINLDSLKRFKQGINKAHKVSPYIGSTTGAILTAPAGSTAANSLIADDEKHSKAKKVALGVGVAGAGGLAGGTISTTATSLAKEMSDKITHPDQMVKPLKSMKFWQYVKK